MDWMVPNYIHGALVPWRSAVHPGNPHATCPACKSLHPGDLYRLLDSHFRSGTTWIDTPCSQPDLNRRQMDRVGFRASQGISVRWVPSGGSPSCLLIDDGINATWTFQIAHLGGLTIEQLDLLLPLISVGGGRFFYRGSDVCWERVWLSGTSSS